MNFKKIAFLSAIWLILGAAGCQGNPAGLGQIVVTTQINRNNTPVAEVAAVVDSAPHIYVAVEVLNAKRGDRVQVVWKSLASDKIVTTETFSGRRSDDRPYEFVGGRWSATSWLASVVTLDDVSWPLGDYVVTVELNQKITKQAGFAIVTEKELDVVSKKALIQNIWLGKAVNSEGQMTLPTTEFVKTDPAIYAVALMKNVPDGTRLEATWKLLETNQVLSKFMTEFSGGGYVVFDLSLQQTGKTIWTRGNYTFTLAVDNVIVSTKNFKIS